MPDIWKKEITVLCESDCMASEKKGISAVKT